LIIGNKFRKEIIVSVHYVLSWQATLAVFVVVVIVMWVLNAVFKMPRWAMFLAAAAMTLAARYYWWWINAQVTSWMRLMGLEV